ncbi:pyruvate dehydrogenase [Rubrobacter marinus]|uniref:Pyruvate dehydrogenase E1 component n=1 Tax=Rubrobacter marinus TaxID=2653852 RepID=A0A6G8PZM5_9ACTN|nr:1-deoxy-D-xylulose-5-phosphate synthase N-terminal domain-containing protein [Rubrobacter marinus]QIN79684.1 pyruvate dehydrogenase [Rubrobacter marinus]
MGSQPETGRAVRSLAAAPETRAAGVEADPETLASVERRVLWLATSVVHHANRVRPNRSGIKVGGHQASSASMVSIMTALWFAHLDAEDRVSVKPHASPVLHAISYLLGRLDRGYMTELRAFGGLQSYPSRTKDPYPVDFSTGSVGLGATAPIWSAVANRYVRERFDAPAAGRQIALIGDAELDEGACWEAIADPAVSGLGEVLWVVDLNRQTLDRVVPNIAADRLQGMFEAAGWSCVTVKYGRLLRSLFARPGGEALRRRIDEMGNAEYQRLLRIPAAELRERLLGDGRGRRELLRLVDGLDDSELLRAVRDLGGHDLGSLVEAYREADAAADRPSVVFAYTVKGRGLPIEGHPQNHSALLTHGQYEGLAHALGADLDDPWARFPEGSAEAELCSEVAGRLDRRGPGDRKAPPDVPTQIGGRYRGETSTQQELGRLLAEMPRTAGPVADRIVTVSPDVASSTNLGGWINKVGIWSLEDRTDWFADDPETMLKWRETRGGQHIELGIAETNLVGLIAELGSTWSRSGEPLFPIGTIYDPFVGRALEPWSFGVYSGGQSILIGTPSGTTLAPEGGAHQSIYTPSIGIEQPGVSAWEPAFGQDLEWTFLHALSRLGRPGGESAYFRLSTRPVDQALAAVPEDAEMREERRRDVLAGGYKLRDASERGLEPVVTLVGVGAMVPEVVRAAEVLEEEGNIGADVVCLTSPDLVFRALRARQGFGEGPYAILDKLFPPQRPLPIVSVLDGHPHTLSFLGSIRTTPVSCLGVTDFGQSGDLEDLYEHHGIDPETIVGAALDVIG